MSTVSTNLPEAVIHVVEAVKEPLASSELLVRIELDLGTLLRHDS